MASKRPQEDSSNDPPGKRPHLDSSRSFFRFECSPWTLAEISHDLPALPKPADPKLEKQAFTHIGGNHDENYERLEWIGDAWLQLIATELISSTFQDNSLKVGRLSQLREQLVKNKTLAGYLRDYGLDRSAVVDAALGQTQQRKETESGKPKHGGLRTIEKVYGDIFEAYVGAIIRSDHENGVQIVADWLKALWGRLIEDELRKIIEAREKTRAQYSRIVPSTPKYTSSEGPSSAAEAPPQTSAEGDTTSNPNVNAKDRLARALLFPGVRLQYEDMPSNKTLKDKEGHTLFAIGVYYHTGWGDSERLAIGKARKKSEAGIRAAEYALQNKKMLKKYGDKKEAFLKARDEREAGDSTGM